ncbi:MAG: HIT family protein [Flavobacteriales bacterium]|jgi:histidine triad (HIT) family protein|tara:strand:+ start:3099 stop:3491 length:393 start_codon:yes stop_codon:yes gene_type:complete
MATIFSKIVNGEIPCYKVYEDDEFLAFLDAFPVSKGHVLVIPKKETDYIFDIEDQSYARMWQFAKKISKALKLSVSCERIGISVIGLEVAHAHIHLLPINSLEDMNFSKPKMSFSKQEFEEIADTIASNI